MRSDILLNKNNQGFVLLEAILSLLILTGMIMILLSVYRSRIEFKNQTQKNIEIARDLVEWSNIFVTDHLYHTPDHIHITDHALTASGPAVNYQIILQQAKWEWRQAEELSESEPEESLDDLDSDNEREDETIDDQELKESTDSWKDEKIDAHENEAEESNGG